jgi:hypothetical protein
LNSIHIRYSSWIFVNLSKKLIDKKACFLPISDRQEGVLSANLGERKIAEEILDFFSTRIRPRIEQSDWVFEGARIFAETYVAQYFRTLRLSGEQAVRYQGQLHKTNEAVVDMLASLASRGKASMAGEICLTKGSDFVDLILIDQLDDEVRQEVEDLYERVERYEELQLNLTLRLIRDMYEIALPRVMFVVRRALKEASNLKPTASDDRLLDPPDYVDWFSTHVAPDGAVYEIIAGEELRSFYRVARNVASHHKGLRWLPKENLVVLEDRNKPPLEVPVHQFQQRYRYLQCFCDYGVRGILASFCGRERGELSYNVCRDYEATFPSEMPNRASRVVKPYFQ